MLVFMSFSFFFVSFFFFFQAEDGIRDLTVTGVQTCALPISSSTRIGWVAETRQPMRVLDVTLEPHWRWVPGLDEERFRSMLSVPIESGPRMRSEERRVGKECRSRWSACDEEKRVR